MVRKSYAKVNIFLKITGKRDEYHEIASRFVKVKSLFDTISFLPREVNGFTLDGDFGCEMQKNTIYKTYLKLKEKYPEVEKYFSSNIVKVDKSIPEFAGLGGGSSNAATFLNMCNEIMDLNLDKDTLANIGKSVGADVPFFVYGYDSANVSGIGEKVEEFMEEPIELEVITPKIKCDTAKVFTLFRKRYYKELDIESVNDIFTKKSTKILDSFDSYEANDLFAAAKDIYPELMDYAKKGWFFSGSGSSFFRKIDD
jgi:4-diphosphocytidyl-2-C-methyl-D-erythritol kinase